MTKFLFGLVLLMWHTSVFAQAFPDDFRHEIKLGIGAEPVPWKGIRDNYGFGNVFTVKPFDLLDKNCYGNLYTTGCIYGSYSYCLLKWLKLGVSVSYSRFWRSYLSGKESSTYILSMPFAELTWINKKFFKMYSTVSIGVTLAKYKDSGISKKEFSLGLSMQYTYLGISAGNKLFAFLELGFGSQGLVGAGMGYRF